MKASKLFGCALAVTYGIYLGKALGAFTVGMLCAAADNSKATEDDSEPESKTE